jgi:UDP-GlcNAc:undecaprenyl-phosphate GlcNAc-1-phosphate transferase
LYPGGSLTLIGLLDDIRGLRAWWKLTGQLLAAAVVWTAGVRINAVLVFPILGPTDLGVVFSFVSTVAWILLITNAINLIDGLDGLAGGVVFFAAVTNVVVAILTDNPLGIALNASLAGAVLGFLFYNFNPAKIFMGDTGSLFLGYAISASALMTVRQKESTLASLLVPLIALGLPLTDTLLAMTRRFLARRSIFSADREHLHHRLLDLGLTHRKAVLVLYGCSVALCVVSVAAVLGKNWTVGGALLFALLVIVGIVRFAGSIQLALRQRQDRAHLYTPATLAVKRVIVALAIRSEGARGEQILETIAELLDPEFFPRIAFRGGDGAEQSIRDLTEVGRKGDVTVRTCHFALALSPGDETGFLEFDCVVDDRLPPQLEVLLRVVADLVEGCLVDHTRSSASNVRFQQEI